jgi:acetoacetyl-CoA synthetase
MVVIPYVSGKPDISAIPNAVLMGDFKSDADGLEIDFAQLPFDHPLYIMYSSAPPACPSAWCRAPAASWSTTSKN